MSGEKLAILVVSCDRYSDLWPAFIELFYRYWPDANISSILEATIFVAMTKE